MGIDIKYVHTNIIARDWKKLSEFYINVFNCKPIYPERDLSGEWIDKLTNINNVRIRGIHLGLPGCHNGPTLEIFQYEPGNPGIDESQINRQGFGHIAFHVDTVEGVLDLLMEHGGEKTGEIIIKEYDGIGVLTVVYAKDPEGNFVEIQNWKK